MLGSRFEVLRLGALHTKLTLARIPAW